MTNQINLHGFAPHEAERILAQANQIRQARKNGPDHCAKSILKAQVIYVLEAQRYAITEKEANETYDGLRQAVELAEAVV